MPNRSEMHHFVSFKDKKIVVFGTGRFGERVAQMVGNEISYFVDNNPSKWDSSFMGANVSNPERLLEEEYSSLTIIIASTYVEEIRQQLIAFGFVEGKHFYNAEKLFINILQHPISDALFRESRVIHEKIAYYKKIGLQQDLDFLYQSFDELNPFAKFYADLGIPLQEEQHYLAFGQMENYQATLYHEAYKLEAQGEIILALEKYEQLLAVAHTSSIEQFIMDRIDNLYSYQTSVLQEQLRAGPSFNEGRFFLHLMMDNIYCKRFIEYVCEHLNPNEHIFVVMIDSNVGSTHFGANTQLNARVIVYEGNAMRGEYRSEELYELISQSKKVFVHFLTDYICWLICRYNIKNKAFYWLLWGGDLYPHIGRELLDPQTSELVDELGLELQKPEESTEQRKNLVLRQGAIRRISSVVTWNTGDNRLLRDYFFTAANHLSFVYQNNIEFDVLDHQLESEARDKDRLVIMVGNSGFPANNHIDVFQWLSSFKEEDFKVIVPLSYGLPHYIKHVIDKGKQLLGDKFVPLTKYLDTASYAQVLRQVDVAIMNHNRQQAASNIFALLYLKKRVYMKPEVTTTEFLTAMGIHLGMIRDGIPFDEIRADYEIQGTANRKLIQDFLSTGNILKMFKKLFD